MRFIVGDDIGQLKTVTFDLKQTSIRQRKTIKKDLYQHKVKGDEDEDSLHIVKIDRLTKGIKGFGIEKLNWCNIKFSDFDKGQLVWIAKGQHQLELFDLNNKKSLYIYQPKDLSIKSKWIGLYNYENKVVLGDSDGNVHVLEFKIEKIEPNSIKVYKLYPNQQKLNLEILKSHPNKSNIFATGGNELDLCIWDLDTFSTDEIIKPLFKAKNVPDDNLSLRVKVWIKDIVFLLNEDNNNNNGYKIVCASHYKTIRVYDTIKKRRPILEFKAGDGPINHLGESIEKNQILTSGTQGDLNVFDVNKGSLLGKYKGITGTVTQMSTHHYKPDAKNFDLLQPLLASISLDRFLRIHQYDPNNRALMTRVYLKARPTALLCDEDSMYNLQSVLDEKEHEDLWKDLEVKKVKR